MQIAGVDPKEVKVDHSNAVLDGDFWVEWIHAGGSPEYLQTTMVNYALIGSLIFTMAWPALLDLLDWSEGNDDAITMAVIITAVLVLIFSCIIVITSTMTIGQLASCVDDATRENFVREYGWTDSFCMFTIAFILICIGLISAMQCFINIENEWAPPVASVLMGISFSVVFKIVSFRILHVVSQPPYLHPPRIRLAPYCLARDREMCYLWLLCTKRLFSVKISFTRARSLSLSLSDSPPPLLVYVYLLIFLSCFVDMYMSTNADHRRHFLLEPG